MKTDQNGALLAEQSFDAWGRRRNPSDWTFTNVPAPSDYFARGYTGHEHMDKFGLINMNGRVYDPLVGRFLNPDIFVKDPTNPIDFNRYMYCHNNPLKYVDPSGYEDTVKLQEFTKQGKRSSPMFIESTSQHPDYSLSDYFISNSEPYVDPAYYAQQNMNNSKDKAKATLDNKKVNQYPNLLPELTVKGFRRKFVGPSIYLRGGGCYGPDGSYNLYSTAENDAACDFMLTWAAGEIAGTVAGVAKLGQVIGKLASKINIPVYRVYGEGASMYGKSYSLINPEYVPFYRNFAGLPEANSGQYLLKGYVPLNEINVGRWFAAPLNGNTGGLPFELYLDFNKLSTPSNVLIKKSF